MNYVTAPAKVIYKALATNDRLTETWTEDCMAADREHAYHLQFRACGHRNFPCRRAYSDEEVEWLCIQSDPDWEGTVVTFELQDLAGKSAVT